VDCLSTHLALSLQNFKSKKETPMPPCTHPSLRYSEDYPKGTKCAQCGEPAESVLSSCRGQLASATQALERVSARVVELESGERLARDARAELESLKRSLGGETEAARKDAEELRAWKIDASKQIAQQVVQIEALSTENERLRAARLAADRAREDMRNRLAPQENNEATIADLRGKLAVMREALGKIKGGWVDRDYPRNVAKEALATLDEAPGGNVHAAR